LDLSRWIAAFLVVAEHARGLIFLPYETRPQPGFWGEVFYFMTGFGHSAVMVFFVMSGFLVGGRVLERLAQATFCWQKYLADRTSRLYAVYLLALLLGGMFDYLGHRYFNQFGLYNLQFPGHIAVINHNFFENLTPSTFIVNLLMCQTILGPVFGSNGPLWSLANEFWYYFAGPVLFALFFTRTLWRKVGCLGVLAGLSWFLPLSISIYFFVWLLGAMLYFVNRRALVPLWISLPMFAVSFSAARLHFLNAPYLADIFIGISFALAINSAALCPRRLPGRLLSRKAADFSYSVYLCHFPFLVFALSVLYSAFGIGLQGSRSALGFIIFVSALAAAYAWCYLISLATERQTPRIREWLYASFRLKPCPASGSVLKPVRTANN